MPQPPYLTIVIAGRNDNYGGDFDLRLQNTLNRYCTQLEQYQVPAELLLVNYNPDLTQPGLEQRITLPQRGKFVTIRMVTATAELHQMYIAEGVRMPLPMFEFPAKNIGIRRAKGEYILSTNADILLPDVVFEFIADRQLKPEFFYRANRADFKGFDMRTCPPGQLIAQCQKHSFKLFMKGFKYDLPAGRPKALTIAWLRVFNDLRLKYHLFKYNYRQLLNKLHIPYVTNNAEYYYHTHNSGDFMLMHRTAWFNLRGNPEQTYIATHADGTAVIMAAASGLKEFVFSQPVYHQDHERRFGWNQIEQEEMFEKEYLKFEHQALQMLNEKKPVQHNSDNWGAAQWQLPELVL